MEEKLIKRLMALMKCESCGQQYAAANVNVLGHREDLWFLRASCPVCQSQCLVAAIIREGALPEAVTDFTRADLVKFKNMENVTADEVLDMHLFLRDFDGDFSGLFAQIV